MKNINLLLIFALLSAVGACYKSGSTDKAKTIPTNANSPAAPSNQTDKPVANGGALDKSVADLEETVKKDPKNYQAYYHLGKNYQALKNEAKAVDSYQKAIAAKPDFAEADYELGTLYAQKKDFQTASPYLQKAAKINYKSAEYLVALGDNYRALKQCNMAIPPYGNSLGFDDKNPAAYYGMGLCYIELKNKIAADSQIRPLEKLDKNLAKKLADAVKQ